MVKSIFLSREPVFTAANFVGRDAALAWLQSELGREKPQNCSIVGEPRSGKTSLLHYVYGNQVGLPPNTAGVYVWLRLVELPHISSQTFWRQALHQLEAELRRADLPLPATPPSGATAVAFFAALDEAITDLLETTDVQRLIFVIDDFDLLCAQLSGEDLDWLRALVTRYSDALAFVISSSEPIARLAAEKQSESPFFNVFVELWLGLLEREAAEQLCQRATEAEDVPLLSDNDVSFLLREAGRHPALLKVACTYFLAARQWSGGETLYLNVRGDFRYDAQVRWLCGQLYKRRPLPQRQILSDLAHDRDADAPDIVLNRMERHLGLVEKRDGRLALFADVFRYWIREETAPGSSLGSRVGDGETAGPVDLPPLRYDAEQRLVRVDGRRETLTPLENRLMAYFFDHPGKVCTVPELLENVWGPGRTSAVVEKAVNRLRTKIEEDPKKPRYILSARGEGYLFRPGS